MAELIENEVQATPARISRPVEDEESMSDIHNVANENSKG